MRSSKEYRGSRKKDADEGVSEEERRRDAIAATVFVLMVVAGVFGMCCIIELVCIAFIGGDFTFTMPAGLTAGAVLVVVAVALLNGTDDDE